MRDISTYSRKPIIGNNIESGEVVHFDSTRDAAKWIIETQQSSSSIISTVSSSITSALKGRENRKPTGKKDSMIRTQAYGYKWRYA